MSGPDVSAHEPDDSALGVLFSQGDERALAWAYERWATLVHGYVCSRLGVGRNAEAVTAHVFVSAWRMRARYCSNDGSLAAWILNITSLHITYADRKHQ